MQLVNQSVHPSPFTYPVSQYHLSELLPTLNAVLNILVCVIFETYVRILGMYLQDKIAEA